jgi:hypothetical protein
MRNIPFLLIPAVLTGCAVYKIAPVDGTASRVPVPTDAQIVMTKVNHYPDGFQCFEPMLFVLTAGIIPQHCIDTYSVTLSGSEPGLPVTTLTEMSGWLPLLLIPLPSWRYGEVKNPQAEIEDFVRTQGH